jgi:hypothetical protein
MSRLFLLFQKIILFGQTKLSENPESTAKDRLDFVNDHFGRNGFGTLEFVARLILAWTP